MSWGTQEVSNRVASVSFRWLAFDEHAEAIRELRRQVFREEQSFGGSRVSSPYDGQGLHLGAFDGQELVAVLSATLFEKPCEELAPYGFASHPGPIVQLGGHVSLPAYRDPRINETLVAMMFQALYETLCPQLCFIRLVGEHRRLRDYYLRRFGLEHHVTLSREDGIEYILRVEGPTRLRALYLQMRRWTQKAEQDRHTQTPSLVHFLEQSGRMSLVPFDKLVGHYLDTTPMTPREERDPAPRSLWASSRVDTSSALPSP